MNHDGACSSVHVRTYVCYGLVSVIKAQGVEGASSLVEPQRGNEKNKQPLPVPLWPEISNTQIPLTITTSKRTDASIFTLFQTQKDQQDRNANFNLNVAILMINS